MTDPTVVPTTVVKPKKNNENRIVVSIDLEMEQPNQEIIEIGICLGSLKDRKIIEKKHFFVKPSQPLSEYISNLTSITQTDLDSAKDLMGAYQDLVQYLSQYKIHKQVVTWGGGDHWALKKQLLDCKVPFQWIFGYTYMNVKSIVQAILGAKYKSTKGGLDTSMEKFKLKFVGTQHRACDDAENTLVLYFKLLELLASLPLE